MQIDTAQGELWEATRELARLGGRAARELIGNVRVSRKPDDTPVTEADHAVQALLLETIAARYPSHSIIVEETVAGPDRHRAIDDAEYCWIIDPIDGTRNYAAGNTVYSTSVCVMHRGAPLAGSIFDATSGKLYSAVVGGGAHCDADRIRMNERPTTRDTLLFVSSFRRKPIPPVVKAWMDHYIFRNLGSLCIHFAWVAAGTADGAYAPECKLWDLAAGALIIQEAGGVITNADGRALWPFDLASYDGEDVPVLAGTRTFHSELLNSLTQ